MDWQIRFFIVLLVTTLTISAYVQAASRLIVEQQSLRHLFEEQEIWKETSKSHF